MPQQINRLIFAFVIFIILFLILHLVLKPESFGEFGDYRGKAIHENTMKELHYAGSDSCAKCHEDILKEKFLGFHKQLKCEVCHGPGLKHALFIEQVNTAQIPDSLILYKPTERKDCAICHQLNAARIKIQFDTINTSMIHQINVIDHNLMDIDTKVEYKCIECHNPHQP